MELARFAFRSKYNNKFLYYVNTEETSNLLVFSGDEIRNPCAKFAVETSSSSEDLVHIRSCFNNKYWVRQSEYSHIIVAAADKREEDQSKWSCTLFRTTEPDGHYGTIRYVHAQLGNSVCLFRANKPAWGCLIAEWSDPDSDFCDIYTTTDWDSLWVLPKYVAFKGDNGTYIGNDQSGGLACFTEGDAKSPYVRNEIIQMPDGNIRIKYVSAEIAWGRRVYYLCNGPDIIFVSEDDISGFPPSSDLFVPIRVRDDVFALRCVVNNKFIRRDGTFVRADEDIVSDQAKLKAEEVVISRKIYNVEFRLDDARIYDEEVLSMDRSETENSTNESDTQVVEFKYADAKSSTWSADLSLKLGGSIQFETGIPIIFDFKVTLSATFEGSYQWGKTEQSSTDLTSSYKVTVPPWTHVTVYLLATQAKCDVPFSYQQLDTLSDGTQIVRDMDDGIYSGVNCYNFTYDVKETPITNPNHK